MKISSIAVCMISHICQISCLIHGSTCSFDDFLFVCFCFYSSHLIFPFRSLICLFGHWMEKLYRPLWSGKATYAFLVCLLAIFLIENKIERLKLLYGVLCLLIWLEILHLSSTIAGHVRHCFFINPNSHSHFSSAWYIYLVLLSGIRQMER